MMQPHSWGNSCNIKAMGVIDEHFEGTISLFCGCGLNSFSPPTGTNNYSKTKQVSVILKGPRLSLKVVIVRCKHPQWYQSHPHHGSTPSSTPWPHSYQHLLRAASAVEDLVLVQAHLVPPSLHPPLLPLVLPPLFSARG